MKYSIVVIALVALLAGCATTRITEDQIQAAAATADYGDFKSETLTVSAWKALEAQDYPKAFAYARKTVEMYDEEARKMNAEMFRFESKETASSKWALNDVGTSLWIMGSAYEAMGMYPEAIETYSNLSKNYTYAQCWDPRGWYWKPAQEAANKVKELQ